MLSEKSTPSIHLAPIPVEGAHPPAGIAPRASVDTRVLLAVSMAQDTVFGVEEWIHWLNTPKAPAGILEIDVRIESAYKSHSTLVLLSVPILAWSRMVDRDAYNFIGFVRSENLLRRSEVQDLDATKEKQSESRLGSQNIDIDESVDSKRIPPAESWHDSGYLGGLGDRAYSDSSDDSVSQPRYSGPIRHRYHSRVPSPSTIRSVSTNPSSASTIRSGSYDITVQDYLVVTSFHKVAHEMDQDFEDKRFRKGLKKISMSFGVMSEGERMCALMGMIENCTREQKGFIRDFLSMKI